MQVNGANQRFLDFARNTPVAKSSTAFLESLAQATKASENAQDKAGSFDSSEFKLNLTRIRIPHIDDEPIAIGDALKTLSKEQKAQLQEKYDINNIAPNSNEYNQLMQELCDMGIISDIPYPFAGENVAYINYGANGFATSYLVKVADKPVSPQGLMGWFNSYLENGIGQYKKIMGLTETTNYEDKIFANQYASNANILQALNEIFER